MKRLLKRNILVILVLLFVVPINIVFFAHYLISPCAPQNSQEILCTERNSLLKFSSDIGKDNVFVTVCGGGLDVLALAFLFESIRKQISPKSKFRENYFPFKWFTVDQLLAPGSTDLIKWSPAFDEFYLSWSDKKTKFLVDQLENKQRILLSGVEGIGKTKEAFEIIKRLDSPKGTFLAVLPEKLRIEELLDLPASLSSRNIVLLLDNIGKISFIEGDEEYLLEKSVEDFSRMFEKIVDRFEKICDQVFIIVTIRSKSIAWEKLEQYLNNEFWKKFYSVELPARNKWDAIQYYGLVSNKFPNIKLHESGIRSIAEKYGGTFASIREYLQIKNDENQGRQPLLIKHADTSDFIGVFPRNWEKKYYDRYIKGKPAYEAVFEALSIISQARIAPYEKLVIALAVRIMNSYLFSTLNEIRVKHAIRDMYPWVRKEEHTLNTSDAYTSGRGDLETNLDKLSNALIDFSHDDRYKYDIMPDLLSYALQLGRDFNNYQLALNIAIRAYEIAPENPRALFTLAVTYDKLEEIDKGIGYCEKVLFIEPNNALASSYLASMCLKRGDVSKNDFLRAENSIKKALSLGMERKESYATYGVVLSRQGKVDEALEVLERVIKLDNDFGYVWSEVGQIYSKKGRYQDAFDAFAKALDLKFYDPNSLNGFGMAAKRLEKFEIARDAFLKSTFLVRDHPMPWSHLGEVYIELGDFKKSINSYKKSLSLDSNNALAWSGLGRAYSEVGEFKKSIVAHNKAIELGDKNYANYYGIGKAYYGAGKIKEAIDAYIHSVKLNSNSPAQYALIKIRHTLSKDTLREKTFIYLISALEKENILLVDEVLEEASRILQMAESGDASSVNLIEHILVTYTGNAQVYNMMSSAYRHLKKYPESVAVADKATKIDPDLASAWYTLGRAYEENKDYVESARAFGKALAIKPDYAKAKEALGRIKDFL